MDMTPPLVTVKALQVFDETLTDEKAAAMIKYATSDALRVAPALATTTDPLLREQAEGILVRAILRWNDSGSGALQQWANGDGPFQRSATIDTRGTASHGIFYPSEEAKLADLFKSKSTRRSGSRWLL